MRLLVEAGTVAGAYQDRVFRNLAGRRLQVDEMWAFIGAKQRNVTPEIAARNPDAGDVWLWVAIDADTKLVPCWALGGRNATIATAFVSNLASRFSNRVQITSDGHKPYIEAIEKAFGSDVDFSILQKIHGSPLENETRHSSATCIGIDVRHVTGNPDPKHVSTPYVERQNLSVRMSLRRYTRLTNAFSRKLENHAAAVALYYFSYNLIKIHGTLRCTPAMAVA
jgi:IS1 family transposase